MNFYGSSDIFQIHRATPNDVVTLAQLHVDAFNETHGPGPSYEVRYQQWQQLFRDKSPSWFCLVIKTQSGDLVGFAKGQPYDHGDHADYQGELNKIYLLKKYQKMGLGRRLFCQCAEEFRKLGITSFLLFGDARNPSNGFYERMGGRKLYAQNGAFHGGYGWDNLDSLIGICQSEIKPDPN